MHDTYRFLSEIADNDCLTETDKLNKYLSHWYGNLFDAEIAVRQNSYASSFNPLKIIPN